MSARKRKPVVRWGDDGSGTLRLGLPSPAHVTTTLTVVWEGRAVAASTLTHLADLGIPATLVAAPKRRRKR